MANELARQLFETGRSHALSSSMLYQSAFRQAEETEIADPEQFAFNGPYSLSTHYLLGLGLELMIKAAIVEWSGKTDEKFLRSIGHNLVQALDIAESVGFSSRAPLLRDILKALQVPFRQDWLRYQRPENFELPGDFEQIVTMLNVLDEELQAKLGVD